MITAAASPSTSLTLTSNTSLRRTNHNSNTNNSHPCYISYHRRGLFRPPRATAGVGGSVMDDFSSSKSFYDLLGISEEGTFEDIKKAYKQMARRYHPDVCPPERAEECTRMFIEVQEAYETLSDPDTRALYDNRFFSAGGFGLGFAFSARRKWKDEGLRDDKFQWRSLWEDQISELRNRSVYKDLDGKDSWGSRMRKQKAKAETSQATV